jgi:Arc/MetJ-type ribon-helix-helix transcriptional regulator
MYDGRLAQPVEHLAYIQGVGGSSPSPPIVGMIWHNMALARRQTLIQLDDARLAALDERAATAGRSRSDLVREAIDLLLGTGDAAAIDAAISEGYARAPAPERDPWASEGAVAAIRAEPW